MDVEENYEPQQQQQQQQQQQPQSANLQQQQQQQMQCDPMYATTTPMPTTTTTNATAAIINPIANNAMMDITSSTTTTTAGHITNTPLVATEAVNIMNSNIAVPLPAPPHMLSLTGPNTTTTSTVIQANGKTPAQLTMSTMTTTTTPPSMTTLPANDIDSLLLQQFSCMGTTDHDDLISQFQSLMNNQMNRESARFYLEMSNWNLQTALGCYLDFCSLQSMPSMKIVQRSQLSATQQAFRLQNDGTERWPNGCFLTSPLQTQRVNVPSIRPGETCDILADIMPTQPAIMWRICTPNGWYFGEAIWMIPPGTQASQDELQQRMVQLITSEVKPESYPQMNIVITANTQ